MNGHLFHHGGHRGHGGFYLFLFILCELCVLCGEINSHLSANVFTCETSINVLIQQYKEKLFSFPFRGTRGVKKCSQR